MDEEIEASAAGLLSEMKAVKAWVELEKARIAGGGDLHNASVEATDASAADPETA